MQDLQDLQDLQNKKIEELKEKLQELNNKNTVGWMDFLNEYIEQTYLNYTVSFDEYDTEEPLEKPKIKKTKKKTNLLEDEIEEKPKKERI